MAEFVLMPQKGLTEESAILAAWHVKKGDNVKEGDFLFDVETGKATFGVESQVAGTVLEILAEEGDEIPIKAVVCVIGSEGETYTVPGAKPEPEASDTKIEETGAQVSVETKAPQAQSSPDGGSERISISPRARALAKQFGIDIETVSPSSGNRITAEDVQKAVKMQVDAAVAEPDEYRIVKHSHIRKVTARNMMNSVQGMAQFTLHTYFDASNILSLREKYKADGLEISLNDMIVYAVSRTILDYPELNAHYNENEMKLFSDAHLGIAVDTNAGLIVPTLFKANQKSLSQISEEIKSLAEKCREEKITPEELSGGAFTISNLGGLNITMFTPIIVPPQTAILGVGCVEYKGSCPDGGKLRFFPAINLSLTIDHRAVDGAPAARYLKALCKILDDFSVEV